LGAILCRASTVTDTMVEASSLGLADSLTNEERNLDLLYPLLDRIREISAFIATRVIRKAQEEVGVFFFLLFTSTHHGLLGR
jgi:malate dehydrogenase (oxaloacetate-decarboxylating)(NADP+)